VLGLLVALICLVGWEALLRHRGYRPSVKDTLDLWAVERRGAEGRPQSLALVGTSRFHYALVPDVLDRELPGHEVKNLALEGTWAISPLRDLALDREFVGTVVCEVLPPTFFTPPGSAVAGRGNASWIEQWRRLPWVTRIETPLRIFTQQRLAFTLPDANTTILLLEARRGRILAPAPTAAIMNERRYPRRLSEVRDPGVAERSWADAFAALPVPAEEERDARIAEVLAYVQAIERRGGSVVFVRINSCGLVLEVEEQRFPRATYWDRLVGEGGLRGIDFQDEPEMAAFTCADGSHLRGSDAEAFSVVLARILRKRGWIE
jgi:hypothetical protein